MTFKFGFLHFLGFSGYICMYLFINIIYLFIYYLDWVFSPYPTAWVFSWNNSHEFSHPQLKPKLPSLSSLNAVLYCD